MDYSTLFNKIDALFPTYTALWAQVCNTESPTGDKAGVDAACGVIAARARALGFAVETLPQAVSGDPVCITMNAGAKGAPVAFSGHLDTVHPHGLFGTPAVRIEGDTIYGPGVADCKGGVVAALLAMHALKETGFTARPILLLLQTDEETGSAGSRKETIQWIARKAQNAAAFLNVEGYNPHTAVLFRKGIARYRFTVTGKAAHASRLWDGVNAIAEAACKIEALAAIPQDREGITVNVGTISGGTTTNSVPETCTFTVDVRFANAQQQKEAVALLQQIAETDYTHGTRCALSVESGRVPMERTERNEALLNALNALYAQAGLPVLSVRGSTGGSDAADITAAGIPAIDSVGVEGDFIHSEREQARVPSLAESAKRLAMAAYLE